jgi:hypothetical protein
MEQGHALAANGRTAHATAANLKHERHGLASTPHATVNEGTATKEKNRSNALIASRLTFDMRGPTRLAGAGPLDGRVGHHASEGH